MIRSRVYLVVAIFPGWSGPATFTFDIRSPRRLCATSSATSGAAFRERQHARRLRFCPLRTPALRCERGRLRLSGLCWAAFRGLRAGDFTISNDQPARRKS
jgi:hypothetical protein